MVLLKKGKEICGTLEIFEIATRHLPFMSNLQQLITGNDGPIDVIKRFDLAFGSLELVYITLMKS